MKLYELEDLELEDLLCLADHALWRAAKRLRLEGEGEKSDRLLAMASKISSERGILSETSPLAWAKP